MAKKLELELKVGLFVTVGVGLILAAILVLGGTQSMFTRNNHYTSHLTSAEGLITGAKVALGGIPVGTVESLRFDGEHHDVELKFTTERDSAKWIRGDSTIEILTQGMLGDKFVSINPGSNDSPQVEEGGDIPYRASKDLSQFLTKGDQLLLSLNSIATDLDRVLHSFERDNRAEVFFKGMSETSHNFSMLSEKLNKQFEDLPVKSTLKNLNSILEKINNGTGTLGALVNDTALYDNVKSLVGGANRNRIMRNLIRQTVEGGIENEAAQTPSNQKKK